MPGKWFVLTLVLTVANSLFAQSAASVLQVSGNYRLRYESLGNTFRANGAGGDQVLASRLLLSVQGEGDHWFGEGELQDSRAWLDDSGTPLGTDDVNTLEPLQAYVGWRHKSDSATIAVKAGRFTLDIGSRRFVARNRFRNTLNAFTGIHLDWQANWHWQAYYTLPVQRQPNNRDALDNNETEWDQDFSKVRFWGMHGAGKTGTDNLEIFMFALQEADQRNLGTSEQNFYTIGGRWLRAPVTQQWDYEVEAAYQFGESRNSAAPTDTIDLDHRASFVHAHLGYQYADTWRSRIAVQFDYASGDKNPNDEQNNRFVTLFGARRFEFGPTGIYGPFIRGNLVTPGIRWEFAPNENMQAFFGYRVVWLDEAKDGLTAAGLRDIGGNSGDFVGQQLETRWRIGLAKNWGTELGAAYLFKGEFLKNAPNAPDTGDTTYIYGDFSYQF